MRAGRQVGAIVAALAMTQLLAGCGSSPGPTRTTSSTSATTSTTAVTTQPNSAIWPFASSPTRFHDPGAAAQSFATAYLHMVGPLIGAFQQGDARSGEVPVRTSSGGPVTTVLVRQVEGGDTWWVIGASTPNLVIESPKVLTEVTSPLPVSGQSTAFEATINLEVRRDGSLTPLVSGTAMGGSMGTMGPFATSLAFSSPGSGGGALVVKTLSAKDGSVQEASVIRIAFIP